MDSNTAPVEAVIDGMTDEDRTSEASQMSAAITFPDGRTEIRADELPKDWQGYVDDMGANIGLAAFEGQPGFISEGQTVFAAPHAGCEATLKRLSGEKPDFTFGLPPGHEFGGRTGFWVTFSRSRY